MNVNALEEFQSPTIKNMRIKSVSAIVYRFRKSFNSPLPKGRNAYTLYFNELGLPTTFASSGKFAGSVYTNTGTLEYNENQKIIKATYIAKKNNKMTYILEVSVKYDEMGRIISSTHFQYPIVPKKPR